jgi:hypothetical protein
MEREKNGSKHAKIVETAKYIKPHLILKNKGERRKI